MKSLNELRERWRRFVRSDLWLTEVSSLDVWRGMALRLARIGMLVARGFREDQLPTQASSLTFATLMSLVPLLAIAFSLLRGLGAGEERLRQLLAWTEQMPEEFQGFMDQILDIVAQTNFAALGWIGVAVLLFTAMTVLSRMESAMNRVWGNTDGRSPFRRFANFISIMVVVPILIGIAGTLMAALQSEEVLERIGMMEFAYRWLLRGAPLLATWLAFSFLYAALPNTRVRAVPALVSGLIGGGMWFAWQRLYIVLQVGVARYNAIYGTFASIPIFLAWLQASWIIVLIGAELTFALQHHTTLSYEYTAERASVRTRLLLTLMVLQRAAFNLRDGGGVLSVQQFSREQHVSVRLVQDICSRLAAAGWLAPVEDSGNGYVLLREPGSIRLQQVVRSLLDDGFDATACGLDGAPAAASEDLRRLDRAIESYLGDRTLSDDIDTVERSG